MILCMELCNCFNLTRAPQDVTDFLNGRNCVKGSFKLNNQRCKCNKGTIATRGTNPIECVEYSDLEGGKNTNLTYSMQYFFLFHKIS